MKDTLKLVLFLWLLGMLPAASLFAQSSDCFGLQLSSHSAEPGDTVCVDVSVHGFTDILGMQHSINWDTAALKFVSLGNFSLGLNQANFAYQNVSAGKIGMLWDSATAQSVTLPDETVFYSICFKVTAAQPGSTSIRFSEIPVPIQFVRQAAGIEAIENFSLRGSNILISSGGASPLTIESACVEAPANCLSDGAFQAMVTGGTAPYAWSFGGGNSGSSSDGAIDANLASGLYELTITDANEQEVMAMVSVSSGNLEIISFSIASPICEQAGSISIDVVNGATGSLTYLWNTGAQTSSISIDEGGIYSVTITDQTGCTVQKTFNVSSLDSFEITAAITNPACSDDPTGAINLTISQPLNDYTFEWSNGAVSQNLSNLTAGTYTVTVADIVTGCQVIESYTLEAQGLSVLTSLGTGCDLPADSVQILSATLNGQSPYTYLWSNGATTASIVVPKVQGSIYLLTVTDANGCSSSVSQTINCSNGQGTLSITGGNVPLGESFCLDVDISNTIPTGAIGLQINWDANILQFDSITNLQMPNPQSASWNDAPGSVDFLWESPGAPLAANAQPAQLLQVCFSALQAGNTAVAFSANASETFLLDENALQSLALFTTGNTVTVTGGSQEAVGIRVTEVAAVRQELACVEVKASNFESITALAHDLNWDAEQLEFNSIINLNPLSELSVSDFNIDDAEDGTLHLSWQAASGESIELDNDETLYEVCFTAIGDESEQAVQFSNSSASNLETSDLVVKTINGKVQISSSADAHYIELSLAPGAVINPGQSACIPVSVVHFDSIIALQYSMAWDPTLLRLDSIQLGDLPALSVAANFAQFPNQGKLSFLWVDPMLGGGTTLMEGAALFNLCFSANGPSGVSKLTFENTPTLIEVVRANDEFVPLLGQGAFITVPGQNVWPGDTDHNGHVNHFDLLPIGLAYNANGPERPDATIDWIAQAAPNWAQSTPTSGVNYKHIDSNGDGTILASDTLAVSQNWGLSVNPFHTEPEAESRVLGVPLYVVADTLSAGQVAALDIILGTTEQLAEDVYGLAFSITYNPELIVPGSVHASFEDSWLGQQSSDLLTMYRVTATQDRIDIAMTRTDGLNNSGNGAIGKLHITIEDVIFRNVFRRAEFGIENVRLISYEEVEIPVAPEMSTSWVSTTTDTRDAELANSIQLYPSPASEYLSITTEGLQVTAVQILDQYGRNVANFENLTDRITVSNLAAGIYVARIQTDRGIAHKTFLIAH